MTAPPTDGAPWTRGLVLTDSRPHSVRDALHEVARALPDHIAVEDDEQQLSHSEFVRATEHVVRLVRASGGHPSEAVSDEASAIVAREVARDGPLVVIEGSRAPRTLPECDATTVDEFAIDPNNLAILHFTSGSTGTPKGIARTHGATVVTALRFAYSQGTTPDDHDAGVAR